MKLGNNITIDRVKPYLVIAIAAILAYLPISSMLFTLKNDVLAIEYPVQHFMSESLRHGQTPVWFNTWCMGFPLHSILTWGVFSTPRVIIGSLFSSDITVLHIEFLLFVMASGWAMFRLLTIHFLTGRNLSLLLSCCYMLSGFTVGSSQWLLYITGMTFIPAVIHCALSLVKNPSFKTSFLFGLAYFFLLTNVHIYFTVFTSYFFLFFFTTFIIKQWLNKEETKERKAKLLKFLSLAAFFVLLLSAAPLYYTIETLSYLERSDPLAESSVFFRSNYLHPEGLKSFLLPLATVKSSYFNTEGSILNTYIGLLPWILLIPTIIITIRSKNKTAWILLGLSLFLLLLSFGHLTPLREWLNILPGFSHFRHPGVLRVFFIMAFILFLGSSLKNISIAELLKPGTPERKYAMISVGLIGLLSFIVMLCSIGSLPGIWKGSAYETTRTVSHGQLILLNSAMQFVFAVLLLISVIKRQQLFSLLVVAELILNFLCCTPFYTSSSQSVKAVNQIFQAQRGFPVQQIPPSEVPVEIKKEGVTIWRNINVFKKEVSTEISMPGPLILEQTGKFLGSPEKNKLLSKPLVFINGSQGNGDTILIMEQKPGLVRANINLLRSKEVVLQQSYFPGWKVYYNKQPLPLSKNEFPFVSAVTPAGKGELVFKFEKKGAVYSAWLLHVITILSLVILAVRKFFVRSVSPSSPY